MNVDDYPVIRVVSKPSWRKWQWTIVVAVLVAAVAVAGYLVAVLAPFDRTPTPVRTLKKHRQRVVTYIESIEAGRIPKREDDGGYYLLDVLGEEGATHVQKNQDCIVITFAFMPTDAVPQLIYSPRGWAGLPEEYRIGGHPNSNRWAFYELTQIDENWFYCLWDQ